MKIRLKKKIWLITNKYSLQYKHIQQNQNIYYHFLQKEHVFIYIYLY